MLKVGITGGIGSGKSIVARMFYALGIPVYDADAAAKRIMHTDPVVRASIIEHFGEDSYTDAGLNRAYIASKVFGDAKQLALLNSLTHPATIRDAEEWMQQQTTAYALKEAALLFESRSNKQLDFIIGVSAPIELRIQRVMERDGISEEDIRKRMDRQMNEEEKMQLCDEVIINDEQQALLPQVLGLHEKLLKKVLST